MDLHDEEVDFGGGAQEKTDAGREMKFLDFRRPGEENLRLATARSVNTAAVPVAVGWIGS